MADTIVNKRPVGKQNVAFKYLVTADDETNGGILFDFQSPFNIVGVAQTYDTTDVVSSFTQTLGTGNDILTTFSGVLGRFADYVSQSLDIEVDGTTINVSATDAATEVLTGEIALFNKDIEVDTGDGVETVFSTTIPAYQLGGYTHQSIDIEVDGVSITVSATDDPIEVLTTTPDVGSGTYNRATGEFSFTFDTAPALDEVISIVYTASLPKGTGTYNRANGTLSFTFEEPVTAGLDVTATYSADVSGNLPVSMVDAEITYPEAGQIRIANNGTFALTENYQIDFVGALLTKL